MGSMKSLIPCRHTVDATGAAPIDLARIIADAPEEDIDAETATRILAVAAEDGESISHDELLRRLGR
jgi:hypothetical protein